jgi:hypothetical protein
MRKFKTITFEVDLLIDEDTTRLDNVSTKIINRVNTITRRLIKVSNFCRKNKLIIKRISTRTFPLN